MAEKDVTGAPLDEANRSDTALEYLMIDVGRLYKTVFNQRAQPRLGLTQPQSRALIHIARNEGINQAGLADILEIQPITVARTLDRLAGDGWVERRPDPNDRRAFTLHLLEKARPVLEEMRALALDLREDFLRTLTDEERIAFERMLEIVWHNLTASDTRNTRKQEDQKTAESAA